MTERSVFRIKTQICGAVLSAAIGFMVHLL